MAKMTKTQRKNAYKSVIAKCRRLWIDTPIGDSTRMTTKDFVAIEHICMKYLKKMG